MLSDIVSLVADVSLKPLSIAVIVAMTVMAILLCASALLSSAEFSFFSISAPQIKLLRSKKNKLADIIIEILDRPHNLFTTLLVANSFLNICLIILLSFLINSTIDFGNSLSLAFVFKIVAISGIILLFGELLPKIYASHFVMRIAFLMAYPIKILSIVLSPINRIFTSISAFNDKQFRQTNSVSLEELSDALDLRTNFISPDKVILSSILRLQKTYVTEIMKSRVDIVSVEISIDFGRITKLIRENNYSRMPVYVGTIDNIKGILYVKDLIPYLDKPDTFSWQSLIRLPYYVPETKKIDSLLEEFQKRHIHMALVVDEYGGTAGLVTLEDIIEEIVGEIHDENDDSLPDYLRLNDSTYIFDGKYLLNDFCKLFEIESEYFEPIQGEADTLAGFILEIKGDFPELYEEIRFKNFIFRIESEDKRRIKRIKVINTQQHTVD